MEVEEPVEENGYGPVRLVLAEELVQVEELGLRERETLVVVGVEEQVVVPLFDAEKDDDDNEGEADDEREEGCVEIVVLRDDAQDEHQRPPEEGGVEGGDDLAHAKIVVEDVEVEVVEEDERAEHHDEDEDDLERVGDQERKGENENELEDYEEGVSARGGFRERVLGGEAALEVDETHDDCVEAEDHGEENPENHEEDVVSDVALDLGELDVHLSPVHGSAVEHLDKSEDHGEEEDRADEVREDPEYA